MTQNSAPIDFRWTSEAERAKRGAIAAPVHHPTPNSVRANQGPPRSLGISSASASLRSSSGPSSLEHEAKVTRAHEGAARWKEGVYECCDKEEGRVTLTTPVNCKRLRNANNIIWSFFRPPSQPAPCGSINHVVIWLERYLRSSSGLYTI